MYYCALHPIYIFCTYWRTGKQIFYIIDYANTSYNEYSVREFRNSYIQDERRAKIVCYMFLKREKKTLDCSISVKIRDRPVYRRVERVHTECIYILYRVYSKSPILFSIDSDVIVCDACFFFFTLLRGQNTRTLLSGVMAYFI